MSEVKKQNNFLSIACGFTLIELLVVIFIIGLIGSYAVLSIGARDSKRPLNKEAEGLRGLLILAMDEALVTGRPIGLLVGTDSYQFMAATYEGWQPIERPAVLKKKFSPQDWRIEVSTSNYSTSDTPNQDLPKMPDMGPQIVFYPSGEVTPFTLSITDMQQKGKVELAFEDED